MAEQVTVFVVDDDEAVRDSLSMALHKRGWTAQDYASAEDFLAAYDQQPGCLILDVRMPGMSGLDLQQALAAKSCTLPIIFITGHGDIPMSVQALKGGAIDFLEKPFRQDVLLTRIEEAIAEDTRVRAVASQREAIRARFSKLSSREKEVVAVLVAGPANHSSKEIAATLDISHRTVDHHRARIMDKMQAESVPELVAMARVCGLDVYTP